MSDKNICMGNSCLLNLNTVNHEPTKYHRIRVDLGLKSVDPLTIIDMLNNLNGWLKDRRKADFWDRRLQEGVEDAVRSFYAEIFYDLISSNPSDYSGWCVTPYIIDQFYNFLDQLRTCSRIQTVVSAWIAVNTTLMGAYIAMAGFGLTITACWLVTRGAATFWLTSSALQGTMCWTPGVRTFYNNMVYYLDNCKNDPIAQNDGNPWA